MSLFSSSHHHANGTFPQDLCSFVCKDLSPDQDFSVQMELSFLVMGSFCPHITDVWGQTAIRSCKSLLHSELRQHNAFQLTIRPKKKKNPSRLLIRSALKLGISFFVLAYGAHDVFRVFTHAVFSL